jgi:O-antigen/teichoic acid export membrane protein
VYADTFLLYLWGTCLLSVLLSLFSREILGVVTTNAYLGADRVIYILSFNYVLIGLNYIAVLGSTIMKSIKPYGIAILAAGILAILLNFLLVPRYGKEGAAMATLLSQLFVPVFVFYRSQKDYPIPYRFGTGALIFIFALASCAVYDRIHGAGGYTAVAWKGITVAVFVSLPFILGFVKRPAWGRKLGG